MADAPRRQLHYYDTADREAHESRHADTTLEGRLRGYRASAAYNEFFPGGTFTADLHGCVWRCADCWSAAGWRDERAPAPTSVAAAADELLDGVKRHALCTMRLTGGEPALQWDFVHALTLEVLERTRGLSYHLGKVTPRRGEVFGVVIETNGLLDVSDLVALEEDAGDDVGRIMLVVGAKSNTPEGLRRCSGLSATAAQAAAMRQRAFVKHLAREARLEFLVTYLEPYVDRAALAVEQRRLERDRGGVGRQMRVLPLVDGDEPFATGAAIEPDAVAAFRAACEGLPPGQLRAPAAIAG
jgi:uncharacterized Fe-S cluster-containing radical SAM superfamily protein